MDYLIYKKKSILNEVLLLSRYLFILCGVPVRMRRLQITMCEVSSGVHVKHVHLHALSTLCDVQDGADGLELSLDMWDGQGLDDHDDQDHGHCTRDAAAAEHHHRNLHCTAVSVDSFYYIVLFCYLIILLKL